jgi:aspartyl-tRNA(Asn)/glutamyl-tRNA(Gln) amidotransferase subunit A
MSSIRCLHHQFKTQQTTANALLQTCLKSAAANPNNAFITLTQEDAVASAQASTDRASTSSLLSPLDGIPIAIKDNFCVQDHLTTASSKMLHNFVAPYDATVVQRLKASGAVIMGKTNMDEFGMGSASVHTYYGPVTNPHNSLHVAGGSSGGSAAAVASGACFAAIGSDTGGSVRQPAAFCGLVGLKPAYGSISRHGLISYASSLDTPGVLARSVEDAYLVLCEIEGGDDLDSTSWPARTARTETMGNGFDGFDGSDGFDGFDGSNSSDGPDGPDGSDGSDGSDGFDGFDGSDGSDLDTKDVGTELQGVTVGVPKECYLEELPNDTVEMWRQGLHELVRRGAAIRTVSLDSIKYAVPAYYIIALAEASSNLARYDGVRYGHRTAAKNGGQNIDTSSNAAAKLHQQYQSSRSEGFGPEVQRRLLTGNFVLSAGAYDQYYGRALRVRDRIRTDFGTVFQQVDCLVCPVTTGSAPTLVDATNPGGSVRTYLQDAMTVPASLAGLPSIAVPRGKDAKELPVGLQIIGDVDYHGAGGCGSALLRCARVLGRGGGGLV